MDEEELASFIAADPVQGVVDLPSPRPPLLLAEIEQAEAAANEAALSTEELSKAQEVFETDNDAYAGEYYDDDVQDEFEEFEAEAEEIKTSRRNSENIVLGDLPVPENVDAGADSSHSGSGAETRQSRTTPYSSPTPPSPTRWPRTRPSSQTTTTA